MTASHRKISSEGDGTSDFLVHDVLKGTGVQKGKIIKISRYLPIVDPKNPPQFIVYFAKEGGKLDAYLGIETNKQGVVHYVAKGVAQASHERARVLPNFFPYLEHADEGIAHDAYREFLKADLSELQEAAKRLSADKIADLLCKPNLAAAHQGVCAKLLGFCGRAAHAKLLRSLIDDPERRAAGYLDDMLLGYVLLEPEEGWIHIRNLIADTKAEFRTRYAGLRTARLLWNQRPDLVEKERLVQGVALLMAHGDMADFAIEDFARWKRWEMTDRVLGLWGKETRDAPVIKRVILRFALQSSAERAKDFVSKQRRRDPQFVGETEELLKSEAGPGAAK